MKGKIWGNKIESIVKGPLKSNFKLVSHFILHNFFLWQLSFALFSVFWNLSLYIYSFCKRDNFLVVRFICSPMLLDNMFEASNSEDWTKFHYFLCSETLPLQICHFAQEKFLVVQFIRFKMLPDNMFDVSNSQNFTQ